MTQYNRYGWGNSDSPQKDVRSSSRACGPRETFQVLWEPTPDWIPTAINVALGILVIGFVCFDTWAIMWLVEVGAR